MGKKNDQAPRTVSEGSWSDYVMINLIIQAWTYTYFLFAANYNSKCFLFHGFNMKTSEYYLVAITGVLFQSLNSEPESLSTSPSSLKICTVVSS